jgi:hypothetical protein
VRMQVVEGNLVKPDQFASHITRLGSTVFETTLNQLALTYTSKSSFAGYPSYEVELPSGCCPHAFQHKSVSMIQKLIDSLDLLFIN